MSSLVWFVSSLVWFSVFGSSILQTNSSVFCFPQRRVKKAEGETIYIKHSNLMLEVGAAAAAARSSLASAAASAPSLCQDLEKTQTQTIRHHNSISELKRTFMESVPEARPSEWDKRLSSSSPFRSVSISEQLQPSVSPHGWSQQHHLGSSYCCSCACCPLCVVTGLMVGQAEPSEEWSSIRR